jgi:hypothetical protein
MASHLVVPPYSLNYMIYDREHLTNLFVPILYGHYVFAPTRFGGLVIPMF